MWDSIRPLLLDIFRCRHRAAADSEELELEREMEYFVEPEEAFTRDEIEERASIGDC